MLERLALITCEEKVQFDPDRVSALTEKLGPVEAEEMICRAMEELAVRLSYTERQYRLGRGVEMRKSARSLAGTARQVGLEALARVATDVVTCANSDDPVALAAVLARLVRIGETSLNAIWDLHDLQI